MPTRTYFYPAATALVLTVFLAGLLGGPAWPVELDWIAALGLWRLAHPQVTGLLIWLTYLGSSFVLLPVTAVVGALLVWRGQRSAASRMIGVTLGGGALVELIKWVVDRPRPSFDPHPVVIYGQSFPSGHSGNSMVTYLAIALFALPARWRGWGIAAAIALAVAIGATRPYLGVHWPSDVIGGWALGLVWTVGWWRVSRRGQSAG